MLFSNEIFNYIPDLVCPCITIFFIFSISRLWYTVRQVNFVAASCNQKKYGLIGYTIESLRGIFQFPDLLNEKFTKVCEPGNGVSPICDQKINYIFRLEAYDHSSSLICSSDPWLSCLPTRSKKYNLFKTMNSLSILRTTRSSSQFTPSQILHGLSQPILYLRYGNTCLEIWWNSRPK
jgi:hypothetical protein